jgi:hypothetical protein
MCLEDDYPMINTSRILYDFTSLETIKRCNRLVGSMKRI